MISIEMRLNLFFKTCSISKWSDLIHFSFSRQFFIDEDKKQRRTIFSFFQEKTVRTVINAFPFLGKCSSKKCNSFFFQLRKDFSSMPSKFGILVKDFFGFVRSLEKTNSNGEDQISIVDHDCHQAFFISSIGDELWSIRLLFSSSMDFFDDRSTWRSSSFNEERYSSTKTETKMNDDLKWLDQVICFQLERKIFSRRRWIFFVSHSFLDQPDENVRHNNVNWFFLGEKKEKIFVLEWKWPMTRSFHRTKDFLQWEKENVFPLEEHWQIHFDRSTKIIEEVIHLEMLQNWFERENLSSSITKGNDSNEIVLNLKKFNVKKTNENDESIC